MSAALFGTAIYNDDLRHPPYAGCLLNGYKYQRIEWARRRVTEARCVMGMCALTRIIAKETRKGADYGHRR